MYSNFNGAAERHRYANSLTRPEIFAETAWFCPPGPDADFRGWFLRKGLSHMNRIQKHHQNLENVYKNVMKTQNRSHN
jgi:hypothetical protein